MKVYISADIEGISGVVEREQLSNQGHDYSRARKLMTEEVNAAIKGALKAGAKEILVNDSHASMTNILIEELHEGARLITGRQKHLGMMQGIDESFDAVMLIGYHARHNTPGVLSHSYHGRAVYGIKLNGNPVGEMEFNSYVAGYFNVPVVLVAGDDVLKEQVKTFKPDVESVVVKESVSRFAANCMHPQEVRKLIKSKAEDVLKNKMKIIMPSKLEGPVEIEMKFMHSGMAENAMLMPGVELISPNTVKYVAKDVLEAYKVRSVLITLGGQ